MRLYSAAIPVLVAAVGFGAWKLGYAQSLAKFAGLDRDAPLIEACEDAYSVLLKSPAGYVRHEISGPTYRPASQADAARFLAGMADEGVIERIIGRSETAQATVVFDAPNAFGTPMRGAFTCDALVERGKPYGSDRLRTYDVLVNGKTKSEWLRSALGD